MAHAVPTPSPQFTVGSIINEQLLANTIVVAGSSHLKNKITWVNLMEILDMPTSVQPGELLITTGFGLENSSKHVGIIQLLESRGVAGLAIQPGVYLNEIPTYIIDEANAIGFPILQLGRDITFSEILRVLIGRVMANGGMTSALGAVRAHATERASQLLSQMEPATKGTFYQIIIQEPGVTQPGDRPHSDKNQCAEMINKLMDLHGAPYTTHIESDGSSVTIAALTDTLTKYLFPLGINLELNRLAHATGAGTHALICAAQMRPDCSPTVAANEALSGLGALSGVGAIRGSAHVDNIPAIAMAAKLSELDFVNDETNTITLLTIRDARHNSELLDTLRNYLATGGNVSRTAEICGIHRHTLLKRLERIKTETGTDPDDPATRACITLDFIARDITGRSLS